MKIQSKFFSLVSIFLLAIGSIMGVGFLSGAEIWVFFAKFGENFFVVLLLLFVLLFFYCLKVFKNIGSEGNTLKMQKTPLNKPKNTILTKSNIKSHFLFLEVLLFSGAMVSGLKSVVYQFFDVFQIEIFILFILIIFVVLCSQSSVLLKFNFVVMLTFFAMLLFVLKDVGISTNIISNLKVISPLNARGLFSGCLLCLCYVFMNIAHLVPVLKNNQMNFSKKGQIGFSLIFSFVICLLIFVYVLFFSKNSHLSADEMPMLKFFESQGKVFYLIFVAVLLGGLLSTLLVCLSDVKEVFHKKLSSKNFAAFLSLILAIFIGILPFNFFINFIYPLVGVLSFVSLTFL